MKKYSKIKGFTLVEILIATAIFATVMIIVVATFSWAIGYNSRLKETRRVGQEVRSAMDEISSNVRLAGGSGKLLVSGSPVSIGEISFFLCSSNALSSCVLNQDAVPFRYKSSMTTADPSADPFISNAVLILQRNASSPKAILYRTELVNGVNYKLTRSESTSVNWNSINLADFGTGTTTVHPNDNSMSMRMWLGGYGPSKMAKTQQPYLEMYLVGETYEYDTISPMMRSKFHLRTMIETRDYNP